MIRNQLLSILFCVLGMSLSFSQVNEGGAMRLLQNLSTEHDDHSPCFSPNGDKIYFSRKSKSRSSNSGENFEIFYTNKVSKGKWSNPIKVNPLSNENESSIGHISMNGSRIYVQGVFKNPKNQKKERGIFLFYNLGDSWRLQEKLDIPYFINKSNDQSFCLSQSEDVLIISMEHYSTQGVEDLYFSTKNQDGKWGEFQSLGRTINTPLEDFSPWLDYDNRTLFFSSNGFKSLGSKDIFVSYRIGNSWTDWTPPINLGPVINSEGMELAFRRSPIDKDHFVLVSAKSSDGHSDLFQYHFPDSILPHPKTIFSIVDNDSLIQKQGPIQMSNQNTVRLTVKNSNRNHFIPYKAILLDDQGLFLDSSSSNPGDTTIFKIIHDTIFLKVSSAEHLSYEKRILFRNTSVGVTSYEEIFLDSLITGKAIRLKNVLFTKGTPDLLYSSYLQLDRVVEFLEDHPEKKIILMGHTDIAGNAQLNQKLSEDRARAVKSYLVDKGIKGSRINTKGFGGSDPISHKRDEESKKRNRRVEFVIL